MTIKTVRISALSETNGKDEELAFSLEGRSGASVPFPLCFYRSYASITALFEWTLPIPTVNRCTIGIELLFCLVFHSQRLKERSVPISKISSKYFM